MKRYAIAFCMIAGVLTCAHACGSKEDSSDRAGNNGSSTGTGTATGISTGRGFGSGGSFNPGAFTVQGAGFYVTVQPTPKTGTDTTSTGPTDVSVGSFTVSCTKVDKGPQSLVDLKLILTRGSSQAVTYQTETTFQTWCQDSMKITVTPLETGDVATLTVTLEDLSGVAYAVGTTASFTQAAPPAPTSTDIGTGPGQPPTPTSTNIDTESGPPPTTGGQGGLGNGSVFQAAEVSITMSSPTDTATQTATATACAAQTSSATATTTGTGSSTGTGT